MLLNKIRNAIHCFLLIFIFLNQTAICSMISAERWELSEKNEQNTVCSQVKTILFLYDSHKRHDNNFRQLKELLHYLRSKGATTSFIAEDPNTFNDLKLSWKQLSRHTTGRNLPLQNSASLGHYCGVLATSVECRPHTSVLNSNVFIEDIIGMTSEQIERIAEYDDGLVLNKEKQRYIERYRSVIAPNSRQLFKNIAEQGCSLNDIRYDQLKYPEEANCVIKSYEPSYDPKNDNVKQKVEEVITCYAREIIDFKILHTLVEHAQKGAKATVIYAGGGHINAIKPVLAKLGYHFCKYPSIRYDDNGHVLPLNVAQAFQELDPSYDPHAQLPKEAIDYFFEYKEREEEDPSLKNRSLLKMFVAAADSLYRYREWKEEHPRLEKLVSATLAATLLSVVCCVVKACCKSS